MIAICWSSAASGIFAIETLLAGESCLDYRTAEDTSLMYDSTIWDLFDADILPNSFHMLMTVV